MPKELTHWIIAEEALKNLPDSSRIKPILIKNHDCYLAGAVLPDTLLHLFNGKHAKTALSLANKFHDCHGNCFAPLIALEEKYGAKLSDAQLACVLGIITHCKADALFHPFVYYQSGNDIGKHYALETNIDIYLQQKNFFPPCKLFGELVTPLTRQTILELCSSVFDPKGTLPERVIDEALALHIRFQARYDKIPWKLMASLLSFFPHTPFGRKSRLFYPLLKVKNVSITGEKECKNPLTGGQSSANCLELMNVSIESISKILSKIEANDFSLSILNGCNGENLLTGIRS